MKTMLKRLGLTLVALTLLAAGAAPTEAASRRYTQVAGGVGHSCGLTASGAVYCWGYNGSGQLGDGTTSSSLSPRAVIGNLKFTSISVGYYHTCGITSRGAAYCWGDNSSGALGDGTTSDASSPQAVIGNLKFTSISAVAYSRTCGLTSRGAAYCWGDNSSGALGDGTTTDSGVNGPQAVIGGLKFVSLGVGWYHACGLTSRGAVYCWGDNSYGQLGDGTTSDASSPQAVIGGLKFASILTGEHQTCGLTSRGAAYCWGYNGGGSLGDGTTSTSGVNGPQAVIGGLKFASLSTGGYHFTCGITSRGAAYCWGSNYYGQLGDGTTTDSGVNGPQAVIGSLKFASIGAGGDHACGLTLRGAAYCWGLNSSGELGDGTTTTSVENGPQSVQ